MGLVFQYDMIITTIATIMALLYLVPYLFKHFFLHQYEGARLYIVHNVRVTATQISFHASLKFS